LVFLRGSIIAVSTMIAAYGAKIAKPCWPARKAKGTQRRCFTRAFVSQNLRGVQGKCVDVIKWRVKMGEE